MLFEIDDRSTVQTFTLNTSSRIEALERELLQLRKRREVFDGVEILQRKKPTTPVVTKSAEASGSGTSKGVAAPPSTSTSTAPPPTIPAAAPAPSSLPPTQSTTTSAPPAPPVHPFANARDATYAPPNVRNFATPPKPSNNKGKEPAYKTIVPIIQPKLAEEIFQRSMKSQFVTLTPEELLSIAPDVRTKYRDAVTPKRVSTEPVASAHIVEIGADEVTAVNQLSCSGATLEPGATIVPDPYETYLKHIPHGEHPAEFTVARDSNAIRSIIALIDNKEQIECIVDPGSQIVAMSEEVCLGLNLLFDPTIQLNMQSANGEVDRSLGLIRNVPFRIDQELQDDFDEEPIPSTVEERTSSPELLGLTTSDYDISTPDLFERSGSSPEPEDPFPSTSNLELPTPSSFRAHAQSPIASSSRLSVIPTSDLAPPPPLAPSNAASNSNPAPPAPTIPSTTTTSSSSPAPTNTTNMNQNANTPLMPPRGHSTAPSFDPSEVRSLRRYFQDLEALFTRCQITDEAAKKQWAVRYPSINVADLWETIESFIDVAKSYNDWKADVRALYPGADDTRNSSENALVSGFTTRQT
ncbi:predicted protein [Postia placenta Mad-698-R]|nr:predicted protein [Postia placenta Mad-698-R]